jgi:hypothetical protein
MRLESIIFVLPTAGQKEASPVEELPSFKSLDRLDGTAFPQYMVEQLYYCDSVNLLPQLALGLAMV